MSFNLPKWFDRSVRQQQLDDHVDRSQTATFGFRQMPAKEKKDWVRRHFDRVAPNYDFMNTLLSLGIHYLWKRIAVARLDLKPGDRVLDVCGGTGDLSILARQKVGRKGQVVVYDINRAMLDAGRDKTTNGQIRNQLHYVQGDAEFISFPDNRFDAVMVSFGIRNVTHLKQAFAEMHRVLKPGGKLLCLEFSKPVNPLFRWLYDFYSFTVMPFLGEILVGDRQGYVCLPETIRLFSLPEELSHILEEIGYERIAYRRLTNGIAVAHTGVRPVE
ncbi:MAG: bifunctional demethylmenaquinone methyltransferase/2-methoxy-6-polyprenyl-1,4-benzoquinol methylase UbiE [Desulfobacterales bacterium]|nr:bifunctional demethylmenaquinone methyltransferase/2-methoxy-6-polyprenyl-1,4-benzoquinol methylase UbiE [Desulfobacterales bacterium]